MLQEKGEYLRLHVSHPEDFPILLLALKASLATITTTAGDSVGVWRSLAIARVKPFRQFARQMTLSLNASFNL